MFRRHSIITAAVLLWLAALVGGLSVLHSYGGQDAPTDAVVNHWVDVSELGPTSDATTMLFFVHPKCPCTSASIDELAELLRELDASKRPDLRVVIRTPERSEIALEWKEEALRGRLAALPNSTLIDDQGGAIARAFGANTSGLLLMFNDAGELTYRGGVTASRGHRGPSTARKTLSQVLNGTHTFGDAPVFGCALFDETCPEPTDCCGSKK